MVGRLRGRGGAFLHLRQTFIIIIIILVVIVYCCCCSVASKPSSNNNNNNNKEEEEEEDEEDVFVGVEEEQVIHDVDKGGGPEGVVWAVQLSDLHFSVHDPTRSLHFSNYVTPTLSLINPSLVLLTGDLTDGKSKDLLTMKQIEAEWQEYRRVMLHLFTTTQLNKSIFYDLRGNHDNFALPSPSSSSSSSDFYSNYSINSLLRRTKHINSVTLQTGEYRHLFVGVDTTSIVGLRGPTNLFGHPTDELLTELDHELSQWNSDSTKTVTKIVFGHFPLSFTANAYSGKSLKDVLLNHSVSAYLCGHLHTKFGKNLKRYHHSGGDHILSPQKFFQLDMNQLIPSANTKNCSSGATAVKEFWEWEMGDWRKNRAMRILAIDRGHVSFLDLDLKSGTKKTIVLPTFPLDSRFMTTTSSRQKYECQYVATSTFETIRALVFSVPPIVSVVARVYDSRPGNLHVVMETFMSKHEHDNTSRGDLYSAPWNYKAFEDPSPDRYWLQITATDSMGRSTSTELRPFSINGLSTKISWTWTEFQVMGIQWAALYYPLLWSAMYFLFCILLIPKALLVFSNLQYTYRNFTANKGFINGSLWVLQEICRSPVLWFGTLAYLFYLVSFPWFSGQVFSHGGERGFMTIMGWAVNSSSDNKQHEYIGFPDVMVIVLPHLLFVVFPTVLVCGAMEAERCLYLENVLSFSRKKEDDYDMGSKNYKYEAGRKAKFSHGIRLIRKVLLLVSLAIYSKHFMGCWVLMKAYEMNPILHFPVYSLTMPLLLAHTAYRTRRV